MPERQDPPHSLTSEEFAQEVWEDESPEPGHLPGTPRQLLDLPIGIASVPMLKCSKLR